MHATKGLTIHMLPGEQVPEFHMGLLKVRDKRIIDVTIWRTKGLVWLLLSAGQAHGELRDDAHESECCARLRTARASLLEARQPRKQRKRVRLL